jgi:hypothetical protein
MRIYLDADAVPNAIKEILFRSVERNRIILVLVANQPVKVPRSEYISSIVVPAGPDKADDRIVELLQEGDLVVTADIPLADRVAEKGAYAIDPRGTLYTVDNIKERLAVRDLMENLRNEGITTGGPSAFSQRDRREFANQLDRFLTGRNMKPERR